MTAAVALWRIAIDTPDYTADDISGAGSKVTGGRWNRKGNAVVYASSTIALACLETVVHLGSTGLPLNRYLVRIEIGAAEWKARRTVEPGDLPVGWDAQPEGKVSLDIGDRWITEAAAPILVVPSAIIPEESNILVNPVLATTLTGVKVRRWLYDPRLIGRRSSSRTSSLP